VHVKIVSARAGHANVSTTLSIYAAFIPNMQADALPVLVDGSQKQSPAGGKW
jgi:hypothetical protein